MTDYSRLKLKDLRQIGKDMGLLRVDKNKKEVLIERLKKGRQLSDYNKNVLLEHARNRGILANAQMSKETILKKITSPKLVEVSNIGVLGPDDSLPLIALIKQKAPKNAREDLNNFHSVINLELHTAEWVPLRGSSYIELPKELKNKKAITNMKNVDNKCFLWCVLRALNPKSTNPERLDKKLKEKENTLNMEGIEFPVKLSDIKKFEKQNETITVTVFGYNEKDKVYPLRKSEHSNRSCKIKLLLIEKEGVSHYCLINNISRLVSSQVSKHDGECFICNNCLNPFPKEESLNKHKEYCDTNECIKISMP